MSCEMQMDEFSKNLQDCKRQHKEDRCSSDAICVFCGNRRDITGERISNRGGHTIATGIRGVIFTRPSVTSTVSSNNPSLFIDNPVLNQHEVSEDNTDRQQVPIETNVYINIQPQILDEENGSINTQEVSHENIDFTNQHQEVTYGNDQHQIPAEPEYVNEPDQVPAEINEYNDGEIPNKEEDNEENTQGRRKKINWRNEYFKEKIDLMEQNTIFKNIILLIEKQKLEIQLRKLDMLQNITNNNSRFVF